MLPITPCLWMEKDARAVAQYYCDIFANSKIINHQEHGDSGHGSFSTAEIEILGNKFQILAAGPLFKPNPSISFFINFNDEESLTFVWNKLLADGSIQMPIDTYPWAEKYGWLSDKYGISWQLSFSTKNKPTQNITPLFMFVGAKAGQAENAIKTYTNIFPDSKIDMVANYEEGDGDKPELIKHAQFTLSGNAFMAMDSSYEHKFGFNEAISFVVHCQTQEELDNYTDKLSAVPEAEQCGWIKDQFGISWQIVPTILYKYLSDSDSTKVQRVSSALMTMKRLNIVELTNAYNGT